MAKSSLVLILVLYYVTLTTSQGEQYSPFTVFLERDSTIDLPDNLILPSKYVNIDEKLRLAGNKYTNPEEIPLCPGLETTDETLKETLETLNNEVPSTTNCLFVAKFSESGEQTCDKEPQPWLVVETDEEENKVINCGSKDSQLISAEYYNCGTERYIKRYSEELSNSQESGTEEPQFEPEPYQMYEVCYDFSNKKTLWTKHKIMTPELLTHKDYPHKNLDTVELENFDTNTFRLELNYMTFISTKNSYKPFNSFRKQHPVDPNMKIYPLVPKDHMALPYWKKSTDHMINSAPLLPEFIQLMKTIHNGILLASNYVHRKYEHTLTIYTKAEKIFSYKHSVSSALYVKPVINHLMPETISTDVFRPSIWYMMVYNEDTEQAVLIVLHNTRENLPEEKECDVKEMSCDFKSWSEDAHLIAADNLEHAYCCPLTQERVKTLFSITDLQIQKSLDIQKLINLEKVTSSKADFDDDDDDDGHAWI